jgi:hypothetical protein
VTTLPGEASPQRTGAYTHKHDLRAIVLPYKLCGESGNEVSNHSYEFYYATEFLCGFSKNATIMAMRALFQFQASRNLECHCH